MSFTFEWPRFSEQFHTDAIQMLNNALNKGNKPPVIADRIEVVELEMGTEPPELEIRDIGDLTVDQFRGIFRLTYDGDAHIVLKTKVQANPLNHKQPDIHLMSGSRGMLAAKQPLVVPMLLRLSHFKLNSYVVLVVSKQKGITLVFKTDPLQNVDINSSFDSIAVIQKFIQKEIEGQLRQMFREDLPGIIHRLSQQWVKAKVEAPYLNKRTAPRPPLSRRQTHDTLSAPDISNYQAPPLASVGLHPHIVRQQSHGPLSYGRATSVSGLSVASTSRRPSQTRSNSSRAHTPPSEEHTSFPDLEDFDPTYGLRPEGVPAKSVFTSFGRLFAPNKGLADLAEEPDDEESEREEYDYDEAASGSFDVVDWEDTVPDFTPPPTVYSDDGPEYETLPAVGGGTITRPRIYHSQSLMHSPPETTSPITARPRPPHLSQSFDLGTGLTHAALSANATTLEHLPPQLGRSRSMFDVPHSAPLFGPGRAMSPDNATQLSHSSSGVTRSIPTPPATENASHVVNRGDDGGIYVKRAASESGRRLSISSSSNFDTFHSGSPPNLHDIPDPNPKIILRPSLNNSIHQLSTLSHSNHTLSPYTRSLSHFTVRSVPPRGPGQSLAGERPPLKAKRRRTYQLGGKKPAGIVTPSVPPSPPSRVPPSEFDASDMDRYFRSRDDLIPHTSNLHPNHIRQRPSNRPSL